METCLLWKNYLVPATNTFLNISYKYNHKNNKNIKIVNI